MNIDYLRIAGMFSFIASALHVGVIIGGASWYRFFGAGEQMALMAERGSFQPVVITFCIALVLAVWGAYAWSAAGIFSALPLLKTALILITLIYLTRGGLGLFAPLFADHPLVAENSMVFWIWSSLICLAIGLTHLKGIFDKWWA